MYINPKLLIYPSPHHLLKTNLEVSNFRTRVLYIDRVTDLNLSLQRLHVPSGAAMGCVTCGLCGHHTAASPFDLVNLQSHPPADWHIPFNVSAEKVGPESSHDLTDQWRRSLQTPVLPAAARRTVVCPPAAHSAAHPQLFQDLLHPAIQISRTGALTAAPTWQPGRMAVTKFSWFLENLYFLNILPAPYRIKAVFCSQQDHI